LKATIDTTKLGKSTEVWRSSTRMTGGPGVFEWKRQQEPLADWPLVKDRGYVRASFGTSAPPVPTTIDLKSAKDRSSRSDSRHRDHHGGFDHSTPRNGWIVIYHEIPTSLPARVVGYRAAL